MRPSEWYESVARGCTNDSRVANHTLTDEGGLYMRKVVLMMSISVDGFVKGPELHAGAFTEPDELKRWKLNRTSAAGTHIMGRVTYEEMASYWPTSTDAYAAPMNAIPKVVFSNTLAEANWPKSSIARGDLTDEIRTLRDQPGGEIIAWGGASFAQSLSRAGLVDEYVLVIHPVAFGSGLPIFRDLPGPLSLELIEAQTFGTGTVLHVYRPSDGTDRGNA
jgi:dihydrofolate reductase